MVRRLFSGALAALALMSVQSAELWGSAQKESVPGYVITKDIRVSRSRAANARFDMTVKAGRVCTQSADNPAWYDFELIDCCEAFVIGKNAVTYYAQHQDVPETRYAKRSVFNQSARKVTVYRDAPSSWEVGKTVTLVPKTKGTIIKKVTVKPVVIKDKDAVYVEGEGNRRDGTYKERKSPMCGKTAYEVTLYYNFGDTCRCYCYNGVQLVRNNLDATGDFLKDYSSELMIDEDGLCYAKGEGETATFRLCHELAAVTGEYPLIGLLGWISATEVVVDDKCLEAQNK